MQLIKFFLSTVAMSVFLSSFLNAQEDGMSGTLRFVVFRDGSPLQNVRLIVDRDISEKTSSDGAVSIPLTEGMHDVKLLTEENTILTEFTAPIVRNELTQIIVTVFPDKLDVEIDLELPAVSSMAELNERTVENKTEEIGRGKLKGRVVSAETGDPVKGVRIFIKKTNFDILTDNSGLFEAELLEGSHSVSAVHPKFSTRTVDSVEVVKDRTNELKIELTPASLELEEYKVMAPHVEGGIASLMSEKKDSSAVADVIGAEQMSRSGDSDAAAALKRVTGLTVVGGKYVYVRGLGERYSCSLLNGSLLPSPEPERRVVPLDLFPVGILESMVIQKSYSPDMPGEFGGGAVLLRTRGVPDEFFFKIQLSGAFSPGSTFGDSIEHDGGKADFMGIDDGSRALPEAIEEQSDKKLVKKGKYDKEGFTSEDIERFGESFNNNWNVNKTTLMPDMGLSMSIGDKFKLPKADIGYIFSVLYSLSHDLTEKNKKGFTVSSGEGDDVKMEKKTDKDHTIANTNVKLGGILGLGVSGSGQEVTSTTIAIRTTDNTTAQIEGWINEIDGNIRETKLLWLEQMLIAQQVHGSHTIPLWIKPVVDWRYTFARASRYEPDRRYYRYDEDIEGDSWSLTGTTRSNERLFSNLLDSSHDIGLDVTLPFNVWKKLEAKAKIGTSMFFKEREVDTRRFQFAGKPSDLSLLSSEPEDLFSPENIGEDGFELREVTRETDNYSAHQELYGVFGLIDLPIVQDLKLSTGLRYERSIQAVETFALYTSEPEIIKSSLITDDFLPSVNLTWEFVKDFQARTGYSITVSRPDLRELSPVTSDNIEDNGETMGNPDLKRALIHSADLRLEWFISTDENIAASFFYKHFIDPIETYSLPGSGDSSTFKNAEKADNVGLELEFRKNMSFIHEKLADLSLAGNFSYIYSRVKVGNEKDRALQGQSPYVVNSQLAYDNTDIGLSVAFLYNVFGKRIAVVGEQGQPHQFEQPFHQLDFVASQKIPYGFKLSFKFKNILDLPAEITQADQTVESYRKGRELSLSLSWDY